MAWPHVWTHHERERDTWVEEGCSDEGRLWMKERNGDGGDVDANPEIKRERKQKAKLAHTHTPHSRTKRLCPVTGARSEIGGKKSFQSRALLPRASILHGPVHHRALGRVVQSVLERLSLFAPSDQMVDPLLWLILHIFQPQFFQ